ncbi:MAG: hypothetical protein ACI9JN_000408 [Bacteroidia bacterium]|jgi:hypothetical protein
MKNTKPFFLLIGICVSTIGGAQTRLPIHAQVSICQKMMEKPENTVSIQELKFNGKRSHSIGLGVSVDFGLNQLGKSETLWMIHSSAYLFTVPIRYSARMPKDIHGFDADVNWTFERYVPGFEASLELLRQTKTSEKWSLRLGIGANIQDMYINPTVLQQSAIVIKDGIRQNQQVVDALFNPFGFGAVPRQKQDLRFNPVYTVGLCMDIDQNRQFVIDLRICHSGQSIVEPFNFLFGDTGDLIYKKSYVGIDLAYRFSLNDQLSNKWIK